MALVSLTHHQYKPFCLGCQVFGKVFPFENGSWLHPAFPKDRQPLRPEVHRPSLVAPIKIPVVMLVSFWCYRERFSFPVSDPRGSICCQCVHFFSLFESCPSSSACLSQYACPPILNTHCSPQMQHPPRLYRGFISSRATANMRIVTAPL